MLQVEYFVPRWWAVETISAIQRMGGRIGPHLFISEIRTIAAAPDVSVVDRSRRP